MNNEPVNQLQAPSIQHRDSRIQNPASRYESFMQNKPNLLNIQMNVSAVKTKYYENVHLRGCAENKPNQTQIFSNGLNNRKSNLRLCTRKENARNSRPCLGGASRYKGVCRHKATKKYAARIEVDVKRYSLGRFDDQIEAAVAYDIKAKEFFGEFAYLNFPNLMRRFKIVNSIS